MLEVQKVTDIRNIPWEFFIVSQSLTLRGRCHLFIGEGGGTVKDGTVKY